MTRLAPRLRTSSGAFVLALSTLAVGTGCGSASDGPSAAKTVQPRSDTHVAAASAAKQLRKLEAEHGVRIGAYAFDTATGRSVGYRAGERFPFASTFKVMACGALLHKARQTDPALLDKVVHYTKDDLVDYSPVTEKHVDTGMTYAELCRAAITQSDNTAGNLVLKGIGGPARLTAFLRSLRDAVSRSDRWETALNDWRPGERRDTTAPRAWADDLRALTSGSTLAPADRDRLTGWMQATVTGDNRIRAGLPKGWTVGDKTGTAGAYGNANDIAVAWPRTSAAPIVMVVLTTRPAADAEPDEKAVAETARILADGLGA